MANVRKNIITQGISGSIDKKIIFKQYGNKTIISSYPDRSKVKLSGKQKKQNKRFREAMAYARSQMADPIAKAEYKARAIGLQRPHNVAIADFYSPPEIKSINTAAFKYRKNDSIIIHATDDFKVVRVSVTIVTNDGNTLENADAVKLDQWKWEYKLQAESMENGKYRIIAQAWDKPGNQAQLEIEVAVC